MKRSYLIYLASMVVSFSCFAQTIIISPKYGEVRGFSEGLAAVEQQGKWGFVDLKGKVVIPLMYIEARDFREGKAGRSAGGFR